MLSFSFRIDMETRSSFVDIASIKPACIVQVIVFFFLFSEVSSESEKEVEKQPVEIKKQVSENDKGDSSLENVSQNKMTEDDSKALVNDNEPRPADIPLDEKEKDTTSELTTGKPEPENIDIPETDDKRIASGLLLSDEKESKREEMKGIIVSSGEDTIPIIEEKATTSKNDAYEETQASQPIDVDKEAYDASVVAKPQDPKQIEKEESSKEDSNSKVHSPPKETVEKPALMTSPSKQQGTEMTCDVEMIDAENAHGKEGNDQKEDQEVRTPMDPYELPKESLVMKQENVAGPGENVLPFVTTSTSAMGQGDIPVTVKKELVEANLFSCEKDTGNKFIESSTAYLKDGSIGKESESGLDKNEKDQQDIDMISADEVPTMVPSTEKQENTSDQNLDVAMTAQTANQASAGSSRSSFEQPLTDEQKQTHRELIDVCIQGLDHCLQRFPQHHKSRYRLAYINLFSPYNKVRSFSYVDPLSCLT